MKCCLSFLCVMALSLGFLTACGEKEEDSTTTTTTRTEPVATATPTTLQPTPTKTAAPATDTPLPPMPTIQAQAPPPVEPTEVPPVPTQPPAPSASRPPLAQQSGDVIVTVLGVEIIAAEDWEWGAIEGAITVGQIDVQISNGGNRWISICPVVPSTITVGTEMAQVSPPTSALLSEEELCADYAPGATKTGKVVFFLRYTTMPDVTSMTYTFWGPSDASTYDKLGADYRFEIAVK